MTPRREFLSTCACAGGLGALSLIGIGCGGKSGSPTQPAPSGTFSVKLADHPALANDNTAVGVSGTPAGSIFVTHTTGSSYFALSRICTHQGCTVNLPGSGAPSILPCPCHGSQYNLNGSVARGPAPQALQSWPVTLNNAVLEINFG